LGFDVCRPTCPQEPFKRTYCMGPVIDLHINCYGLGIPDSAIPPPPLARQASTSAPICLPPTVLACPNAYALQVLAADSARPPAQSPLGVALERARTNQIGNNARHSSTVGQFVLVLRSRTIASTCLQLASTVSALPWHCATNRSVPAGPGCSPGAGPVRSRRSSSGTLTRLSSSRRSMDRTDLSRPLSARSIGGLVEFLVGGTQQREDLVMEGR
jgi:hypothetical protein